MRRTNRYKKSPGGRYAVRGILLLVLLAVFLYAGTRLVQRELPSRSQPSASRPLRPPSDVVQSSYSGHPAPQSGPQATHPARSTSERHSALPGGQARGGAARLAVIIDDMGSAVSEARDLARIGVPLTCSVIPGLSHYGEVAGVAASSGMDVMIHIPMQPKEWPKRRLEANGLLLSMDGAAIRKQMEEYLRELPQAIGANNHMGSEFTEHEEQMRTVLGVLKERGLFFVDSVTSPHSVGLRLTRDIGLRAARRDVFLDNEQDATYIRSQLGQAVRYARQTGSAIAICHPHPTTIRVLAETLPKLAGEGIVLVKVSQLVR